MRRSAFFLCLASLLTALPNTLNATDAELRGYLESHCFECHDSSTKKGGLDLEALPLQFEAHERFETWARVHDRVASGEMPPKSRRQRPSAEETVNALKLLDDHLYNADAARITKTGRALFRRLTTQEFENALRDLLHLRGLRIKELLPEDERRHGYNKIGQALNLSNVHLSQFMDAAEVALTAAIATRSTPPPVRRVRFGGAAIPDAMTWMAHGSAVPLKDKQYDPVVPLPSPDDDLNANQELKKSRYATLGKVLRDYPHAGGYFTGATHRPMIFHWNMRPSTRASIASARLRGASGGIAARWSRRIAMNPSRSPRGCPPTDRASCIRHRAGSGFLMCRRSKAACMNSPAGSM